MQKWLMFLMMLLAVTQTQAQDVPKEDVIELENGSIIRGQILEYEPKGKIKIEIQGGSVLVYDAEEVVKIKKEPMKNPPPKPAPQPMPNYYNPYKIEKPPLKLKTEGVYHHIDFGLLFGVDQYRFPSAGMNASYTGGYQFNNYVACGLGIQWTSLTPGYHFFPIYADFRGYFSKKPTSFYYNLQAGYSMPTAPTGWQMIGQNDFEGARGGIYLYPNIGLRVGSRKITNFTIDVGLQMMGAAFDYTPNPWNNPWNDPWNPNPTPPPPPTEEDMFTERLMMYRFVIRCGILF